MQLAIVKPSETMAIPYPSDTKVKGWKFVIDYERIYQSDTWSLATPEMRPWLLMLWITAWSQYPCGTLPNDDTLISAKIGMDQRIFRGHKDILMRGWYIAEDGRLYHPVITEQVLSMIESRKAATIRQHNCRSEKKQRLTAVVTRESQCSTPLVTAPEPEPVPEPLENYSLRESSSPSAKTIPPCPAEKIVDAYHRNLPTLRQVVVLNDSRRKMLTSRWRELHAAGEFSTQADGVKAFEDYFSYVSKSKLLTGRVPPKEDRPPWSADFEWLIKPQNFVKVIEGKYHG